MEQQTVARKASARSVEDSPDLVGWERSILGTVGPTAYAGSGSQGGMVRVQPRVPPGVGNLFAHTASVDDLGLGGGLFAAYEHTLALRVVNSPCSERQSVTFVISIEPAESLSSDEASGRAPKEDEPLMPTEDTFESLAQTNPPRLLAWIRDGGLTGAAQSFAAEAAGRISDTAAVAVVLIPLLAHSSPPVREGAIYGLQRHLHDAGIRQALGKAAESDPSPGVRAAAEEALEQEVD